MNLGILIPIAAVTIGPIAWVANNWIRAKHGYPLEGRRGELAVREDPALAAENAALRSQVERLEERLRVLERIATDPAERTAREIEALR
ncbi:MAG: hypothetical protein JO013_04185 [Alphaproteobacteria bacterium]|nr:hypothetical protein [Alphaproteobacteria bacterium]